MSKRESFVSIKDFIPKTKMLFSREYSSQDFLSDLFSGIAVSFIALPLAIAFSIAAGATPSQGLWTAIITGFLVAAIGGSKFMVTGPASSFVIIIANIIVNFGMEGLIIATILAGIILIVMGLSGLGKLIKFIPYPVTTGFTTGIAVVIAVTQLRDFLGIQPSTWPGDFFERLGVVASSIHTLNPVTLGLGLGTIIIILLIRRFVPKIPAAVVAVAIISVIVFVFKLPVDTIGSRYGEFPKGLPKFAIPQFKWHLVKDVFPSAFTIALLVSIETLMSAVVADGMTGDRHNPNMELVAQGAGNLLAGLFGGIPSTGALARTAANIKSGARSPVSSMVHAVILFVFTMFLSGLAALIPMTALAGVLLVVSWDMSEMRRFLLMRYAPKSDMVVMLVTFGLTVAVDISLALQVGVVLAVFLFLKRITETSSVTPALDALLPKDQFPDSIPKSVEVYEITGPFFFGTADFLQDVLDQIENPPEIFILKMDRVPSVDATGLNALEAFRLHCARHYTRLILSGVRNQVCKAMRETGMLDRLGVDNLFDDIDLALAAAHASIEENERRKEALGHGIDI